jgi:hypothetical protein
MSQKKVDEYKEKKANRKELIKKEKRKNMLVRGAGTLFFVLIVGWIGYSVYDSYMASRPRQVVEVDYTSINQYIEGMSVTE